VSARLELIRPIEKEIVMSQKKIFPFLWYAKDAEEAARFYTSIFPNSHVEGVTALQSESPSGPPGSVTAGPHHEFNDAISMVVLHGLHALSDTRARSSGC
jgi:predicted 3-demethylubiquinone-9 3-methyltransferase (glyoxalase superfamily)